MATISENLQTIADSTAAIKQAIIDKGGTIEGDITTWASAIEGISGGDEYDNVFFGTAEINSLYYDIYGELLQPFDEDGIILAIAKYNNRFLLGYSNILYGNIDTYVEISLNVDEPFNNNLPFIMIFVNNSFTSFKKIIADIS